MQIENLIKLLWARKSKEREEWKKELAKLSKEAVKNIGNGIVTIYWMSNLYGDRADYRQKKVAKEFSQAFNKKVEDLLKKAVELSNDKTDPVEEVRWIANIAWAGKDLDYLSSQIDTWWLDRDWDHDIDDLEDAKKLAEKIIDEEREWQVTELKREKGQIAWLYFGNAKPGDLDRMDKEMWI